MPSLRINRPIFRALLGIDGIAAAVALYLFVTALHDGSVSSFNALTWLALLGSIAAVTVASVALRAQGHRRLASLLLMMLAGPGLLAGLLLLMLLAGNPHWN